METLLSMMSIMDSLEIRNLDAILNCLEAGEVAYDERRREYEMLKN